MDLSSTTPSKRNKLEFIAELRLLLVFNASKYCATLHNTCTQYLLYCYRTISIHKQQITKREHTHIRNRWKRFEWMWLECEKKQL